MVLTFFSTRNWKTVLNFGIFIVKNQFWNLTKNLNSNHKLYLISVKCTCVNMHLDDPKACFSVKLSGLLKVDARIMEIFCTIAIIRMLLHTNTKNWKLCQGFHNLDVHSIWDYCQVLFMKKFVKTKVRNFIHLIYSATRYHKLKIFLEPAMFCHLAVLI